MKGIQIKINGEWIYLPDDFSITLEHTSPVFNEQGTFSFPFEIPLESNRSIFKNIADPFGDISLHDLDKSPAEVWFGGVMLYRGIIEIDEEVELEEAIPVTFLSGNSDFMSRIEELNARDIPLDREIKLGYVVTRMKNKPDAPVSALAYLPDYVMMNYTEYNISKPYPLSPFCNVRVCTSTEKGYYKILEAKRPFSGVCFYVMYLLDCLLKHMSIISRRNDLYLLEDMTRLAFFSTQCHVSYSTDTREIPLSEIRAKDFCGDIFDITYAVRTGSTNSNIKYYGSENFLFYGSDVYATNENFPEVTISELIEDLMNAFGVRFLYDSRLNCMDIIFVKDILRSSEEIELPVHILDYYLVKSKNKTIKITYGDSDDTAFNYNDYSDVVEYEDYNHLLEGGINSFDKKCKIDKKTGNAYRVKVNKETGGSPSLFEVGGFRDYIINKNKSDKENEQVITLNFRPVIINSVQGGKNDDGSASIGNNSGNNLVDKDNILSGQSSNTHNKNSNSQSRPGIMSPLSDGERLLAIFADVELNSSPVIDKSLYESNQYEGGSSVFVTERSMTIKALCPELYDTESNQEPPLRKYDAGYTLGIMRGPGDESKLEIVNNDYDGEGNSSWVQTVGNYAFTSDSCDNYGRFFDYNGTEEGGADQNGRFSLKLIPEKEGYPIDNNYKDRGLVSKFLSEYLYFMANKKTIVLTVKMSITQIIGIDFLKRYKIGGFVGFINKVSYTLNVNGVVDSTIELYTL